MLELWQGLRGLTVRMKIIAGQICNLEEAPENVNRNYDKKKKMNHQNGINRQKKLSMKFDEIYQIIRLKDKS